MHNINSWCLIAEPITLHIFSDHSQDIWPQSHINQFKAFIIEKREYKINLIALLSSAHTFCKSGQSERFSCGEMKAAGLYRETSCYLIIWKLMTYRISVQKNMGRAHSYSQTALAKLLGAYNIMAHFKDIWQRTALVRRKRETTANHIAIQR